MFAKQSAQGGGSWTEPLPPPRASINYRTMFINSYKENELYDRIYEERVRKRRYLPEEISTEAYHHLSPVTTTSTITSQLHVATATTIKSPGNVHNNIRLSQIDANSSSHNVPRSIHKKKIKRKRKKLMPKRSNGLMQKLIDMYHKSHLASHVARIKRGHRSESSAHIDQRAFVYQPFYQSNKYLAVHDDRIISIQDMNSPEGSFRYFMMITSI